MINEMLSLFKAKFLNQWLCIRKEILRRDQLVVSKVQLLKERYLKKQYRGNKASPKTQKDLKKEMGDVNYRKWANNWDPVVDVARVKPKVDTNFQHALELTQREKLLSKTENFDKKKKRVKSARSRETYIDQELQRKQQRMPSKEERYKNIFYAKNRYQEVPDHAKENLHLVLNYETNARFLNEKIKVQNQKFEKEYKKMKLEEYSKKVKQQNRAKITEQKKQGKIPGMYTSKLIDDAQRLKSKENNLDREKRRKAREERTQKGPISVNERDNNLLYKIMETTEKKKKLKKNVKNKDLFF
mmetsp:Transcript_16543/g.14445  ORF Transcript_16543/g.14445 Transcript_16543/m.14445 type:complete len:300 (+) Transcript_16543:135-1034(+)